jgi:hypothetical protein
MTGCSLFPKYKTKLEKALVTNKLTKFYGIFSVLATSTCGQRVVSHKVFIYDSLHKY